jgi:23S rRNA (uracil1939-C5)-methyltransferase
VAGFHQLERPAHVLDVDQRCLLPEHPVADAWGELRASWGPGAQLLPAGASLRLTLRSSLAGQVALLVEGGQGTGQPEELLRRVPAIAALWLSEGSGAPPVLAAGVEELDESWGDEQVALNGDVFLQVNRTAAALLEAQVFALARTVAGMRVVDAYCGVGLHARRLARAGALVTGLEVDGPAVRQAAAAAPPGATFLEGRVEDLLPRALPAQLVILNPPRTGVHGAALEALLQQPPDRIIYISCDPATLARDLSRLASGFAVQSLHCFDLFPQTSHVETVAELACSTT